MIPLVPLAALTLFNLSQSSTKSPHTRCFPRPSGMATFPNVTALDYSVLKGPRSLEQEPIPVPRFEFQFTSNFDFYSLGKRDFVYLDPPYNHFATIQTDIASCLWESLKMKVRYILAAARHGNCDSAVDLLSTFISNAKLQEIDMVHPPFPPAHQLTSNPFLRPGHPAVVESWVLNWQNTSRMLAAWIAKAQENSIRTSNPSWCWPTSPHSLASTADALSDSGSSDIASTANELSTIFEAKSAPPAQAVLASHAHASLIPLKRAHNSPPIDATRDGDNPSKKQLVMWRPSISQLLEAQQTLATGEVPSGRSISSTPRTPPCSPSMTLDPRLRINDPRLQTTSPAQARHALVSSLARLQRFHHLVRGSPAD